MHYHAEVYVPPQTLNIETFVSEAMAPYKEQDHDDESHSDFWDWYQIGGRWTGIKTPDYVPEKDPRNFEVCQLCRGTGFRNDQIGIEARNAAPTYTCNGCGKYDNEEKIWKHNLYGSGLALKWPSSWVRHEGDILPITKVPQNLDCFTLIANGQVFHKEKWNGDDFVKTEFNGLVIPKLKELGIEGGFLVTVDYHS